jgi:hypothetical protein
MSAITISSDSPAFSYQAPSCVIDAESIDTSYVYDSEYQPSCSTSDLVVIGGGADGSNGSDGADGTDGLSLVTADAGGATVTDVIFLSFAGRAAKQYDSFINTNGGDKVYWVRGTTVWSNINSIIGADGATGATGDTGATGNTGANGNDGSDGADGATITTGTTVPTGGNNGDLYIRTTNYDLYKKISDVWTIIGNILGTTGAAGAAGSNGIDGDQWTYSAAVPTSSTLNDFDSYHLHTVTKDVYYKAEQSSSWAVVANLNGSKYDTTSSTSVNLTTTSVSDTVVLTVDSGLAYSTGQFAVVANSTTEQFTGKVTSYSGTTLTLVVTYIIGTSTLTSWAINLAGVVESGSVPQWYTITATAGGGDATSRVYTGPSGWTIDTSDVVAATDLGTNPLDLTIEHGTGLSVTACNIFSFTSGTNRNTKLNGTAAYDTLRESAGLAAVEITSLATVNEPLLIKINLQ